MVSLEDIFAAYYDCRKNKRNTHSAIEFEIDYENRLIEIWKAVNNGTYKPKDSIAFIVTKPRPREIFAAAFDDRVLHHYIDMKVRPLMEIDFIDTTCNNRVGKGTEACVKYVEKFIYEESNGYKEDCWICKMDMSSFFMSISKSLLITKITKYIDIRYNGDDKDNIKWLLSIVLGDNPEKHCNRKSDLAEWYKIDKSKSLFTIDDDLGLPIGNLISQLHANFYLNDFDHYVTEELGFKSYTRYVDDFVIIHKNKGYILDCIPKMRHKLEEIGISLHKKKFYLQHYSKGVEIVGAVVKPYRMYLHNRTVNNAFRAVDRINKLKRTNDNKARMFSVVNSYLGFMKHRSAYKLRERLIYALDKKWWKCVYGGTKCYKLIMKKEYKTNKQIKNKLYGSTKYGL